MPAIAKRWQFMHASPGRMVLPFPLVQYAPLLQVGGPENAGANTNRAVPVTLEVSVPTRPPASVESAAYFVVAEALTNVAKHADATRVDVSIVLQNNRLLVDIRDDGVGGADSAKGTGLSGLADRVSALGGWTRVLSPTGGPTSVIVEIPCGS